MDGSSQSLPDAEEKQRPHMDIDLWLSTLRMEEYMDLFKNFAGVEDLLEFRGRELLELGVKKTRDRNQLATSLAILKEKYQKALRKKTERLKSGEDSDGYINSKGGSSSELSASADDVEMLASRFRLGPTLLERGPRYPPQSTPLHLLNSSVGERSSALNFSEESEEAELRKAPPSNGAKLPRRRLKDQAYFHGRITRLAAQEMLQSPGQFLVRSCISQPGDYVLSVAWGGKVLHFMINRVLLPLGDGDPEDYDYVEAGNKTLYQFEEEQFASICDLIDFHISHRKQITDASGAIISIPVQRAASKEEEALRPLHSELQGAYVDMQPSAGATAPPLPSRPRHVAVATSSSRLLPLRERVLLRQAGGALSKAVSESQLHRSGLSTAAEAAAAVEILANPPMKASPSRSLHSLKGPPTLPLPQPPKAPAKPRRAPSLTKRDRPTLIVRNRQGKFKEISATAGPEEDYDDIDYAEMDEADSAHLNDSYDEPRKVKKDALKAPPSLPPRQPIERDSACVPDFSVYDSPSAERRRVEEARELPERRNSRLSADYQPSSPSLAAVWATSGPLDDGLTASILKLLVEPSTPACLAEELAREDGRWLGLDAAGEGLAQILLPSGEELRRELLDRAKALSLFVTATLVKGDAGTLRAWLETCVVLTKLDLFALDAIVVALDSPEVETLTGLWEGVKARKPSLYHRYQDSILPAHRACGKGEELATVPHLQPILRLMTPQEDQGFVESLDIGGLWGLLSTARLWGAATPSLCQRYAGLRSHPQVEDVAAPGLHRHFLFGAKGAPAPLSQHRFDKVQRVLSLMAEKRTLQGFDDASAPSTPL